VTDRLTSAQLEELAAALRSEQARLWARGGVELGAIDGPEPMDLQDRAKDEVQSRDTLALSDRDQARLVDVEAALGRVAQGTYGFCEETGEPIPFARLQAEPTTRYTVEALELIEDEESRERVRGPQSDDDAY
jgi:DnaK suppressor protein